MNLPLFIFATVFVASSLQEKITPVWKNNLLTTIPKWGREYRVYFQVKPISVVHATSNIIHFTVKNNCCGLGDRIPAVWFQANSWKLTVATAINKAGNFHWNDKKNLPKDKFSTVEIKQVRDTKGKYMYSVMVNGKVVQSAENKEPKVYKNVKVYAGDSWYVASDVVLKNFQYTVEPEFTGNIKRGRKLKTIPLWGKEWRMSFKIKPLSAQKPWTSIVHLTTGKDAGAPGTRIPSVMLYPNSKRLTVFTQLGTNNAWSYTTPKDLPVIKYTNVHIEQLMNKHGKFYLKIVIDGKVVINTLQSKPTNYKNVILYASNPWYAHADVYVRDLHLEGISGQHYYPTL